MTKRISVTILVLTLIISCFTAFAAETSDLAKDEKYEEVIEAFEMLGIFGGDISYFERETVTRAQMAELTYALLGSLELTVEGSRHYMDVKETHSSYKEIESVSFLNLMSGRGNQMFEPDAPISYNEAIKTLVCALGYSDLAEAQGGYSSGYSKVAVSKKILGSMNVIMGNGEITGRDLAVLMYNVLHTNIMKTSSFGYKEGGFKETQEETDEDVLRYYHNITVVRGVFDSDSVTNIYGNSPCQDGKITINGASYKTEIGSTLLGYSVDAYIKDTDDDKKGDTVLYLRKDGAKNKFLRIDAYDIQGYNNLTYNYNETKKAVITKDTKVMYNGKQMSPYDETLYEPAYGYIELISNDGDNVYDILFIHDQKTIAVDTVSINSGLIVDAYNSANSIHIEEENPDIDYKIFKGNAEISIKQIKSGSVLTVEKSQDGTVVRGFLSEATVEGELGTLATKTMKIGENEYEFVPNIIATADMKVGEYAAFLLDVNGRVAGKESDTGAGWKYAMKFDTASDGVFDKEVSIKLFTQKDKIEIFDMASKVTVDGVRLNEEDTEIPLSSTDGALLRYKCNDNNEITHIDTVGAVKTTDDALNRTATKVDRAYNASYYTFSGKLNLSADTVVIQVNPDTSCAEDEKYRIISRSSMKANTSYPVEAFSANYDLLTADVLLVHKIVVGSTVISDTAKWMVIESIGQGLDADGENVYIAHGFCNGYVQSVLFDVDCDVSPVGLENGDIIRFAQNSDKEITGWQKIYDVQTEEICLNTVYTNNKIYHTFHDGVEQENISYSADFFAGIGFVIKSSDSQTAITFDNDFSWPALSAKSFIYNIGNAKIYVYNKNIDGTVTVNIGEQTDLIGYDIDSQNPSRVIVNTHWSGPTEIFILK